jgi:hypothetical protein
VHSASDGLIISPSTFQARTFSAATGASILAMTFTTFITGFIAPVFIIISPITSYADQTYAIHRTRSSAGFSLDIPLIMLVSSILRYVLSTSPFINRERSGVFSQNPADSTMHRIFYYPGAQFDTSLLIQAFIMVAIQLVLLQVALDNRPAPSNKGGELSVPFAGSHEREFGATRPYKFWQWRSPKPYAPCSCVPVLTCL